MKKDKSVKLTQIFVRACYALLALAVVILPFVFNDFDLVDMMPDPPKASYILVPFYLIVPAGYVALVCLDKLLCNIKRDIVFDAKNVRLLDIISWACVYAGAAGVASFVAVTLLYDAFPTYIILAAGELFMALVVNVVKKLFDKAIEIKEENDLTV